MNNSNQLSRVCSNCGVQKPLSAFLQLDSVHGSNYSNVCADCRAIAAKSKSIPTIKDKGESGSTSSGFRIGAKAKVTADQVRQRQTQTIKDLHQKEIRKREQLKNEKELATDQKQLTEKEHRTFYIESKKQGFLSGTKKTVPTRQIARKVNQTRTTLPQRDKQAEHAEIKKLEDSIEQELRLTTIDLTLPFLDPQFSEIRHHSTLFIQFKQWLGSGAPIAKASLLKSLDQLYNNPAQTLKNTPSEKENPSEEKKDPLIDYIEKTWSPSSTRRR